MLEVTRTAETLPWDTRDYPILYNQINVVANAPFSDKYQHSNWESFVEWEAKQQELQLDIETGIESYWCTKKLITIQFGQVGHKNGLKVQWVLQWSALNESQRTYIKGIIEGPKQKLIHNSAFEIIVLRFYGMHLVNPFCTMLAEKILNTGIENENVSLLDVAFKYLHYTMDKSEQKTFGDDILTENKVIYAASDVKDLDLIRGFQLPEIHKWKLQAVLELENEACLSFCDVTFHGMLIDRNKWRENEELAQPIVDASKAALNAWLLTTAFKERAMELKFIYEVDTMFINYNSPAQKSELLQLLFPGIAGGSMLIIKKYIRDNGPMLSGSDLNVLLSLQEKNYSPFSDKLVAEHRDYLVSHDYLLPANTACINWNSVQQALPLIKLIAPRLQDLSEESLANVAHPIVEDLHNYKDALKLTGTYGQSFLDKHVEPDGKIRAEFNQIVSTGRVSCMRPNMQQIPAKESPMEIVQPWLDKNPGKTYNDFTTRYRNAFICEPNEVFVDSDFTGQELAIIAHVSKDPLWLKTIEEGKDLHSVCAELVYGGKWLDAKADGCSYYKKVNGEIAKEKCKCPGHKTMRNSVKTVNFGLAYGMGEIGLSNKVHITVPEAKALIELYFKALPKISGILKYLGDFGVKNGYIQTLAPFFRKRWFPFWKFAQARIVPFLAGQNDATLSSIQRASKNTPIQGCGSDMMKYAMVLVRRWIYENGYQDKIRIVMQVHDQLTTICTKELSEMWKAQFDLLMQEAAKAIIPSGILKADTQITPFWTK